MSGEITVGINDIMESLNEVKAGIEGLQNEINLLARRGFTTLQVPSSEVMPWLEGDDPTGVVVDPAPTGGTPTPTGSDPEWQAQRACKLWALEGYDASSVALLLDSACYGIKKANQ